MCLQMFVQKWKCQNWESYLLLRRDQEFVTQHFRARVIMFRRAPGQMIVAALTGVMGLFALFHY